MMQMINLDNPIYKKALKLKGELSQLIISAEEASELNHALLKLIRNMVFEEPDCGKKSTKIKVAEEIADVLILIEQLCYNYGDDFIQQIKDFKGYKLQRLEKRLK